MLNENIDVMSQTISEAVNSKESVEKEIIETLKKIYDPEIPVNIWDLGLIYKVDVDTDFKVKIEMTLTAPNCPMAEDLVWEVKERVKILPTVSSVEVNLVFEPAWYPDLMTEEAKLELGFL